MLRVTLPPSDTPPVDVVPMAIVPADFAFIERFALVPLSVVVMATVPPVAAPVTFRPATCVAAEESIWKAGVVAPRRPTDRDAAEADVTVTAPDTPKDVNAPTEVNDDAVTPEASVAPVRFAAGTAFAVIEVLQPNPVFVVQIKADEAVEHVPMASAVGDAVPLVALPTMVFVA